MPSIQLITPHSQEIKRKWHILFHFHPFSLFPFHSLLSFSLVSQLFLPFTPFLFLSVTMNCRSEHIFYHPLFSFPFFFFLQVVAIIISPLCALYSHLGILRSCFTTDVGDGANFGKPLQPIVELLCNLTGMPLHPHSRYRKARCALWFSHSSQWCISKFHTSQRILIKYSLAFQTTGIASVSQRSV